MDTVEIYIHKEPDGIWADSPHIPWWSAAASGMERLRALTDEAVELHVDGEVTVMHLVVA